MSGGRFNYQDRSLTTEMFGWYVDAIYSFNSKNKDYKAYVSQVRRQNVFEDKLISELVYDVMCLIHSYDWYASSDICEETYLEDVKFFKKKWLKPMPESYVRELVDEELGIAKQELLKALVINKGDGDART